MNDPCRCGDINTWHPECYTSGEEAKKRAWLRILPAPEHTYSWNEHPEDYDGPCCCADCRYYAGLGEG